MDRAAFDRLAGNSALLAAVTGFLYSVVFVAFVRGSEWAAMPSAILLMLTGLLSIPVVTALYERFKDSPFALLGFVFGILGAAGPLIHGGYDLAVLLYPGRGRLPANQVDPMGLLTFGITALAVLVFARLLAADGNFRSLALNGYVLAALLLVIYLGRLLIFDPNQPVLGLSALAAGLIVGPAWYFRVGRLIKAGAVAIPPAVEDPEA